MPLRRPISKKQIKPNFNVKFSVQNNLNSKQKQALFNYYKKKLEEKRELERQK
ncbi:MAG: hypothetical protein PHN22_02525 [Candidatus ainarchaeum sp.]|nr:hypothetical protein [Candidatus ainarchaeum sp.]